MPLHLPSINFFRLSRKRDNNAQHCVELVDLDQSDADYRFQHEHSVCEESPAPPPNTLCAASSVVLQHQSSHFGLDLEFGGDFERDWLRRFGSSNSISSSLTVVHHGPFVSTADATADTTAAAATETTAASEALTSTSTPTSTPTSTFTPTSISTSPNPPSRLAATVRGRFKSAFKPNINTIINKPSTAHSSRLRTSRAHANHDSAAATRAKNGRSATVASSARDRSCPPPPPPPMSNPAHPPPRWRCCRCARVNGFGNSTARAYDALTNRNRNHNRNHNRNRVTHAYSSMTAATAMENGTWTCICGHSFEPCLLSARLRRLRRVQRKGGDVGVAFERG